MALYNNVESQGPGPWTGGYGNGYNGLLEGLLFASAFGGRRDCGRDRDESLAGDVASRVSELQNTANLRKEVQEIGTEVHKLGNEIMKESADQSRLILKEVNDNFRDLDNRMCDAEKEVLISRHQLSKEIMENTLRVKDEVVERAINLKDQINDLHHCMDKQFCHTNSEIQKSKQDILNQLAADKLDEKNDIIARLRAKNDRLHDNIQFGDRLTAINSQIMDLAQHQRATQQTIQFGQGNLAGQANTNQQVR